TRARTGPSFRERPQRGGPIRLGPTGPHSPRPDRTDRSALASARPDRLGALAPTRSLGPTGATRGSRPDPLPRPRSPELSLGQTPGPSAATRELRLVMTRSPAPPSTNNFF